MGFTVHVEYTSTPPGRTILCCVSIDEMLDPALDGSGEELPLIGSEFVQLGQRDGVCGAGALA